MLGKTKRGIEEKAEGIREKAGGIGAEVKDCRG